MSGSARYTAILDACVLYPAPLRDLLLSLARSGLYHARWTSHIQNEWVRNLLANRPDLKADDIERTCRAMNSSVLDCMVENYETIASSLTLPDPGDTHVLGAAIIGHADAIVTFNLKDFPAEVLSPFNIEAQHPDDFIANQLELRELEALAAIKAMRARSGLYHARWTSHIQNEWVRNLLANRPDLKADDIERTCRAMNSSVLDCMVENYETIASSLTLPDPGDTHVLGAAIIGHADAIVTFNLKDFPAEVLSPFNIEAQHPDDFIANQLELRELEALAAIKAMRARLRNPPKTANELIATFERSQLPLTASILRAAADLI